MDGDKNNLSLRDAEEVGCYGLLGGWAKNLYTHEAFHASDAHRSNGPFYCAVCYSDAVVRKCTEKRDHFAHTSRLSPVLGPKEKLLHDACTKEICTLLSAKYPDGNWAVERPILENREKGLAAVVPDISGRINRAPVVVEVQVSALKINRILKRTTEYAKRGISILWVVPLSQPLGDLPFRPRLYERYLHSMYFGRTYYWWAGLGLTLKPVHYGTATRHIEYREWFESGGEQKSAGGYDRDYRTIKTPVYGEDLLMDTSFSKELRASFTPDNEKKAVPACNIWRDTHSPWW